VKFTPAGGSVTVRSANNGRRLGVEVIDTGPGIPAKMVEDLFKPFNATAQASKSLGIGLAVTRSLIEMHGGTIAAGSPPSGSGAMLTVDLPVAVEEAPPAKGQTFAGRILLVEDHQDTRNVMARLLASFGFNVAVAGTVAEANELSTSQHFDLLISDIGLPDGTGNDVMRELKRHSDAKGIALSGYGQADDLRRSEEAGFDAHLVKPINFQTLKTMLEQLLK
jgi:CheY-like chemotaxis protein